MQHSKPKLKLQQTPHKPGVYLMKDRLGGIIYVGKAKDLKKRLGSYFTPVPKNAIRCKNASIDR